MKSLQENMLNSAAAAGIISWFSAMILFVYSIMDWEMNLIVSIAVILLAVSLPLFLAFDLLLFMLWWLRPGNA